MTAEQTTSSNEACELCLKLRNELVFNYRVFVSLWLPTAENCLMWLINVFLSDMYTSRVLHMTGGVTMATRKHHIAVLNHLLWCCSSRIQTKRNSEQNRYWCRRRESYLKHVYDLSKSTWTDKSEEEFLSDFSQIFFIFLLLNVRVFNNYLNEKYNQS